MPQWIKKFAGLNKKQIWKLYTGGSGYPSLGTFYKHVRDEGVTQYLERCFCYDFEVVLQGMGINDKEITSLIEQAKNIS